MLFRQKQTWSMNAVSFEVEFWSNFYHPSSSWETDEDHTESVRVLRTSFSRKIWETDSWVETISLTLSLVLPRRVAKNFYPYTVWLQCDYSVTKQLDDDRPENLVRKRQHHKVNDQSKKSTKESAKKSWARVVLTFFETDTASQTRKGRLSHFMPWLRLVNWCSVLCHPQVSANTSVIFTPPTKKSSGKEPLHPRDCHHQSLCFSSSLRRRTFNAWVQDHTKNEASTTNTTCLSCTSSTSSLFTSSSLSQGSKMGHR